MATLGCRRRCILAVTVGRQLLGGFAVLWLRFIRIRGGILLDRRGLGGGGDSGWGGDSSSSSSSSRRRRRWDIGSGRGCCCRCVQSRVQQAQRFVHDTIKEIGPCRQLGTGLIRSQQSRHASAARQIYVFGMVGRGKGHCGRGGGGERGHGTHLSVSTASGGGGFVTGKGTIAFPKAKVQHIIDDTFRHIGQGSETWFTTFHDVTHGLEEIPFNALAGEQVKHIQVVKGGAIVVSPRRSAARGKALSHIGNHAPCQCHGRFPDAGGKSGQGGIDPFGDTRVVRIKAIEGRIENVTDNARVINIRVRIISTSSTNSQPIPLVLGLETIHQIARRRQVKTLRG
eukprot:scaffold24072_cov125-Amphora_coffeaeformis.AAC.5